MPQYNTEVLDNNTQRFEVVLVTPDSGKPYAFLKDTANRYAKGDANKAKVESVRRVSQTRERFLTMMSRYWDIVDAHVNVEDEDTQVIFTTKPEEVPTVPLARKVVTIPRPTPTAKPAASEYELETASEWATILRASAKSKKAVKILVDTKSEFGEIEGYLRGIQGTTAFWTTNHKSKLRGADGKVLGNVKRSNVTDIFPRD